MASFVFPNNPTDDQLVVNSDTGLTYRWLADPGKWIIQTIAEPTVDALPLTGGVMMGPITFSADQPTGTDTVDDSITASFLEGNNYIPIPSAVESVIQVWPFTDTGGGSNMFDIRYQLRLNDLFDLSSTSVIQYQMAMDNLDLLEHILVGEQPIRFNQHQNRLYIDADWENDFTAGEDYIIVECYRKLDPTTYTDIYDDIFLKRYATALIKAQWGSNLSKFQGVTMLGGVTMDGGTIYSQAQEEITKLEEQIALTFELPVNYMVG